MQWPRRCIYIFGQCDIEMLKFAYKILTALENCRCLERNHFRTAIMKIMQASFLIANLRNLTISAYILPSISRKDIDKFCRARVTASLYFMAHGP